MFGYHWSALVVDDEDLVRKLTARALDRRGFVCTQATNGSEAAALLSKRRFDILVTDLRMPDGNGYALAMDQLERDERPLIVILTGVMEPRLAQDLLRRGIDDIMFKPVDYEMFAGKLAGLMERRILRKNSEVKEPEVKCKMVSTTPELNQSAKAPCDESPKTSEIVSLETVPQPNRL